MSVPHVPRPATLFPREAPTAKPLKQEAFSGLFPVSALKMRLENCGPAPLTTSCLVLMPLLWRAACICACDAGTGAARPHPRPQAADPREGQPRPAHRQDVI